ncbi:MAG: ATP-binding protein [Novosphingobium sp.]|nr:ATP-binding protein [Novosphingobium sp.]
MCHTIAMGAGKRFSAELQPGGDTRAIVIAALAAAEELAAGADLAERDGARLAVIVEELISNALRHGAAEGRLRLDLRLGADADALTLALEDDGAAFDPTAARSFAGPDAETGGGVGLALVRAWAESLDYARVDGRNRLSLVLRRGG